MRQYNFKIIALLFFLILFWSFSAISIALIALPNNALSVSRNNKYLTGLIPEGWGFFTRNPREGILYVFVRENGEWQPYSKQNNASINNLFGIKRTARFNGLIYGSYFKQIPPANWKSYRDLNLNKLNSISLSPVKIKDNTKYPEFCGKTIMFIRTNTIPWAWSSGTRGSSGMVFNISQIYVECD